MYSWSFYFENFLHEITLAFLNMIGIDRDKRLKYPFYNNNRSNKILTHIFIGIISIGCRRLEFSMWNLKKQTIVCMLQMSHLNLPMGEIKPNSLPTTIDVIIIKNRHCLYETTKSNFHLSMSKQSIRLNNLRVMCFRCFV